LQATALHRKPVSGGGTAQPPCEGLHSPALGNRAGKIYQLDAALAISYYVYP